MLTAMSNTSNPGNEERKVTLPLLFEDSCTSEHYANHRHSYSEEVFHIVTDYCQALSPDLQLALDVGCGPGNSTLGFTKYFQQVIGVDISETQIALAPKDVQNCEFRVGCTTNLDFLTSASVDLVSCGLVFNLLPNWKYMYLRFCQSF